MPKPIDFKSLKPKIQSPRISRLKIPLQQGHSKWLREGDQTHITKTVFSFARDLKGPNPKYDGSPKRDPSHDLKIAAAAIKALRSFEKIQTPIEFVREYYAKRTADQIVSSRKIMIGDKSVQDAGFHVNGCVDYATALASVLRARQIPSVFVRALDHSVVYFFSNNEWFKADPFNNLLVPLSQSEQRRFLESQAGQNHFRVFAAGLDASGVGIHTLADYHKFNP